MVAGVMTVRIDIVSDVVCPWCWLGKKRLEAALEQSGETAEITWRPYELDPAVPEAGTAYKDYMRAKFGDGPDDRFTKMREHLEAAAPDAGINFRFSELTVRPSTLNAHRLIRWAQGQKKGDAVVEALFRAYFDELRDIGDLAVLSEIAGESGLDSIIVADLLATDRDKSEVRAEENYFRGLGVSGVPTFIFEGQYGVSGAQEPETLIGIIEKARKAA